MSMRNFINEPNANKKVSIYTSIVTFILGVVWVSVNLIWRGRTVTKEEAIAVVIILLGLNAVSFGSDLRGFLKILKGDQKKILKEKSGDNDDKNS
ncbi:hypothetical protein [Brachyspira alvinipulli]|uniref:hypothetical protein n=1 Tax=Brachyspira alvinipulli TaxID=84379 RepID=UPI0004813453|nr:hypothetical protein [Brachyspira alvinipulli]